MSDSPQKKLWSQILNTTHKRLKANTDKLRKEIGTKLGQIYILDPYSLETLIKEFLSGTVKKYKKFGLTEKEREKAIFTFDKDAFNKIVENCRAKAVSVENRNFKTLTDARQKRRLNYIKKIILGQGKAGPLPIPANSSAYVFKNYEQAVTFHQDILEDQIKPFILTIINTIEDTGVRGKLTSQLNTSILNVGHGASVGASVAALQSGKEIKAAISKAKKQGLDTTELENILNTTLNQYAKVGLSTNDVDFEIQQEYSTEIIKEFYIGKTGKLLGGYVSVLSLQSTWDNNIDSKTEKQIKQDVAKEILNLKNKIITTEGSDPLVKGIEKVLFYSVANKGKNFKNLRFKGEAKAEYRSVNKFNISHKTSGRVKAGKAQKAKKVTSTFASIGASQNSPEKIFMQPEVESPSPLQVVAYINTRLQQEIEKNMIPPALESRTGRFSGSVKVLNMLQTRKGFPSFEYTYDKNPYQVFEIGVGRQPWATVDRDPRKLIDKSIREIAAEMLQGRLYTRRV